MSTASIFESWDVSVSQSRPDDLMPLYSRRLFATSPKTSHAQVWRTPKFGSAMTRAGYFSGPRPPSPWGWSAGSSWPTVSQKNPNQTIHPEPPDSLTHPISPVSLTPPTSAHAMLTAMVTLDDSETSSFFTEGPSNQEDTLERGFSCGLKYGHRCRQKDGCQRRTVVTLMTKSILSLFLVGLAIVNLVTMLEVLGRTNAKPADPKRRDD